MGLSEQEQRLLEEMERGFYASEADSVSASPTVRSRPSYRAIIAGVLSVVVGVILLVSAVGVGQIWLGVAGFAVMLAGVLYMFSPGNQIVSGGQTGKSNPNETFAQKVERRWEQRMDGEL